MPAVLSRPEAAAAFQSAPPPSSWPAGTWPDWSGQRAVICASGPSFSQEQAETIRQAHRQGRVKVLAINRAGLDRCPWADVLYASDQDFWENYPAAREFLGFKVTQSAVACDWWPQLHQVAVDTDAPLMLFDIPGRIWSGGNSGAQGINLVAQWGSREIALVGFDMNVDKGRHFHPDHPTRSHQPTPECCIRWREALGRAAGQLEGRGIKVVNCSGETALGCFPRRSLKDWLS